MKTQNIHIGSLIYNKLKLDGRSVAWLAKQIHCEKNNIYKILKKTSIDSALLLLISLALNTDFFAYYSNIYKDNCKNI